MFGAMPGRVVGGVGVPAGPDDPQPGPAEDPDGLGMALAAGAGVGVELGRPWGPMSGVVGEDVEGLAGAAVGGQAEVDAAGLARRAGDRGRAGLGGGVLGAAGAVQDGAELGKELGVADVADAGERGARAILEASRKKTCLAPGQWASSSAPSWLLAAVLAATWSSRSRTSDCSSRVAGSTGSSRRSRWPSVRR